VTRDFHEWAARHRIAPAAIVELAQILGATDPVTIAGRGEAHVQSSVRLEATGVGARLFRNNIGALPDRTGRVVRYGIANDTEKLNKRLKSSDLIGWRRVLITPAHVGRTIAQFLVRECKPGGWKYSGDEHEAAQLRWIELVAAEGGDAAFATGVGTL
jgi:hypothetical protein